MFQNPHCTTNFCRTLLCLGANLWFPRTLFYIFWFYYLYSLHTFVSVFIKTMKISDSFQVYYAFLLLCFFFPRVYFKTCNRSEARCLARWLRYIKRITITMWLRRRRHCFLWGSHPNICFFWHVFIPVTVGDLFKIPFSRVYNLDWKLTFFPKSK